MNKFSWYEASSVDDALKQLDATVSESLTGKTNTSILKSGGVDVIDLLKEGLLQPKQIVNIRNIAGLDKIENSSDGLRIGANVTLAMLEEDETVKNNYQAFHQSIKHAATPQLRNMATIGGNLAQRTRCWYFRSEHHNCLRKGGSKCYAHEGENEMHSIIDNESCVSVHSSSISTALLAFDAKVEIKSRKGTREIDLEEFFIAPKEDVKRENILKSNEIITAVILPKNKNGTRSFYLKHGQRESYDWALADVAVKAEINGGSAKNAKVVLGAAAPVPMVSEEASKNIEGKSINEQNAMATAEAAMRIAKPLSKNGYKVPIFKTLIKRALMEIA